MANPYILIKVPDVLEWRPLSRTKVALTDVERDKFAYWLMALYKKRLQVAIKNQKFPMRYAPLSPRWVTYKKNHKMKAGFWQATENLRRNIQIWKKGGAYMIGFKAREMHPVWKKPYAQIVASLERGNPEGGLPPRPLFTPIARSISRHMGDHLSKYLEMHNA